MKIKILIIYALLWVATQIFGEKYIVNYYNKSHMHSEVGTCIEINNGYALALAPLILVTNLKCDGSTSIKLWLVANVSNGVLELARIK